MRRAAAVALAAGALAVGSGTGAWALDDGLITGARNVDQEGEQNLDCGNTAALVRFNVARTDNDHANKRCADTDGHTRHYGKDRGGAVAIGDTTLGPQTNIAQSGRQNLYCGNSADMITVNAVGTINQDTTCTAVADGKRTHPRHAKGSRAVGGTSVGQQVNVAQSGAQNVYCGNSSEVATVNVLGTIRKHTTCIAADHSHGHGPAVHHRGRAVADAGEVIGTETNTAQNGRQNQTCGTPGNGIDIPLGQIKRDTTCGVQDSSLTVHR
ncbi:hypothetical protein [Streptomyces antibioticus]|uniref:hypothetical protein n=1 Tax=Streptomyces antibioticus TaxID=1890 RepID=UPI0033D3A433